MKKNQILFIITILILILGISLDLFGIGFIAKILIIIGAISSILLSISHKKAALTECARLENEVAEYERKSQSVIDEVHTLKERIKNIENINNISQKHFEEIQKAITKEELSKNFINSICDDLKASKGAFFLQNDNKLILSSSYAYKSENEEPLTFEIGDGLIGQAALNKKSIILKDIPEDYVEINSGLGKAKPKNIIILPVTFSNEVLGVIELATFSTLTDDELKLLELIAGNIATKLSSFKN